ncbi:MAG: threonylcarbamoyl-AMP synthase, partial [Rhodospirillales bacterium]|nr:threonylcarbamoyl-AMP synthase [Rhodospirillales bacterium]
MSKSPAPVFDPENGIATAAKALQSGQLVGIPTETVYGLGGDATNDDAVAAIFEAKGRPSFNPLIIHLADEDSAWDHVIPCDAARKLAEAFWPGPLTLVLPRRPESGVSLLASAGLDTLAIRVPAHPTARLLLMTANTPVAAPSANKSGTISPTRAEHVAGPFAG